MGKIYKRKGSPFWYLRIGDQRFSSFTTSKTKAEDLLHRKEHELWQQRFNVQDNTEVGLHDFFSKYLDWLRVNRRPETVKSYRSVIKGLIDFSKSYHQVKRLKDITPSLLEDYKIARAKEVKSWTVNNHIKVLKTIFNKALEWGYVFHNPTSKVGYIEISDAKPIRYLSEDEYRIFMETCKKDFVEYYPIFYTFIHTGMRKGEILGLEWADVDFKKGFIHVRSNDDFRPKGIDKKTHRAKARIIPIHNNLKGLLCKIKKPTGKVFTYRGGAYSDNRLRRILMLIADKAGIKGLTRLHELRHSYATFLVKHGVDIYKIKELLGHSDIRDTMKYAHVPTEFMKEDVKKLEFLDH